MLAYFCMPFLSFDDILCRTSVEYERARERTRARVTEIVKKSSRIMEWELCVEFTVRRILNS